MNDKPQTPAETPTDDQVTALPAEPFADEAAYEAYVSSEFGAGHLAAALDLGSHTQEAWAALSLEDRHAELAATVKDDDAPPVDAPAAPPAADAPPPAPPPTSATPEPAKPAGRSRKGHKPASGARGVRQKVLDNLAEVAAAANPAAVPRTPVVLTTSALRNSAGEAVARGRIGLVRDDAVDELMAAGKVRLLTKADEDVIAREESVGREPAVIAY